MEKILSVPERIDRAKRVQKAVRACTHEDPEKRVSAYAAARKYKVSQSAISQNRDYRAFKDRGDKPNEIP